MKEGTRGIISAIAKAGMAAALITSCSSSSDERPAPTTIAEAPGMVLIPEGTYTVGSTQEEIEAFGKLCRPVLDPGCHSDNFRDELPVRKVQSKAFLMDATEVTTGEFATFVDRTSYKTEAENVGHSQVWNAETHTFDITAGADWRHPNGPGSSSLGRESHPVSHVTLADAGEYCRSVGKRLPTEDEWEIAARGLKSTLYTWGDKFDPSNLAPVEASDTSPVGSYLKDLSYFGVFDMAGNVSEWVDDNSGIRRGASFPSGPAFHHAAWKASPDSQKLSRSTLGFRCTADT